MTSEDKDRWTVKCNGCGTKEQDICFEMDEWTTGTLYWCPQCAVGRETQLISIGRSHLNDEQGCWLVKVTQNQRTFEVLGEWWWDGKEWSEDCHKMQMMAYEAAVQLRKILNEGR